MISSEEENGDFFVPKLGDFGNEGNKAFGDYFPIFKPKIENITQKEDFLCISRDFF
jgi:hypothetical protein